MKKVITALFYLLLPMLGIAQTSAMEQDSTVRDRQYEELEKTIDTFYYHYQYEEAFLYAQQIEKFARASYPVGHERYIEGVFYLGALQMEVGEYEKAQPLLEEVIALTNEHTISDHRKLSNWLERLPILYQELGDYEKALTHFEKGLQHAKDNLPEDNAQQIVYRNHLANIYRETGQYDTAIQYAQEALTLAEKQLQSGQDNVDFVFHYGNTLNGLALIYKQTGDYEKAANLYRQNIELTEQQLGKEDPEYMLALNNLGGFYVQIGQYQKAAPLYVTALNITKQLYQKEHPTYLSQLNNLGVLFFRMGQYERASPLFEEIVAITARTLGTNHTKYASRLNNLASLYFRMGQYEKTLPLYLEALEITALSLGKEHPTYGKRLNNLSLLYKKMGQYDKALPYQVEALAITEKSVGKDHADYINRLISLAYLYQQVGEFDKAFALSKSGLNYFNTPAKEAEPNYIALISSLAEGYLNTQQYEKALPLLEEALDRRTQSVGKSNISYCSQLEDLGSYYEKIGNLIQAEEYYKESVNTTQKIMGTKYPDYGNRLSKLALVYQKSKQYDKAFVAYQQCAQNFQYQLQTYYPAISEGERIQFLKTLMPQVHQLFSFGLKEHRLTESIQDLHLSLKGLALEGSIDTRKQLLQGLDSLAQEQYYEWIALKRNIAKAYTLSLEEQINKGIILDSLQRLAEQLEGALARQVASTNLVAKKEASALKLRQALSKKEAAIDFLQFQYHNGQSWTDSIYYCALVSRKKMKQPQLVFLSEARPLEKRLRATIRKNGANYIANEQINQDISALVWQPLQVYLKKVKRVHLSPTGLLYQVSFNALQLPTKKQGLLMDTYEIVYYGNLRDFLDSKQRPPLHSNQGITLVGGAEYDMDSTALTQLVTAIQPIQIQYNSPTIAQLTEAAMTRSLEEDSLRSAIRFNYLPGTLSEVEAIRQQFDVKGWPIRLLIGQDASEDQLLQLNGANAPSILHLATHGYFFKPQKTKNKKDTNLRERLQASDNPLLRSGLVFTGANHVWEGGANIVGLEDGVWSALEISNMNLINTNLVVLSACQTGLGDIHQEEGVFGLQRAFKTAGVNHLLMSLWKIPDQETAELMQLFYHYYLLQGQNARTALKKTQLALRKKYAPFYWAGFILLE